MDRRTQRHVIAYDDRDQPDPFARVSGIVFYGLWAFGFLVLADMADMAATLRRLHTILLHGGARR